MSAPLRKFARAASSMPNTIDYERALPQVTEDCIQVIYIADVPALIAGLIAARLSNDLFKPIL